jgi:hypothetical protein
VIQITKLGVLTQIPPDSKSNEPEKGKNGAFVVTKTPGTGISLQKI